NGFCHPADPLSEQLAAAKIVDGQHDALKVVPPYAVVCKRGQAQDAGSKPNGLKLSKLGSVRSIGSRNARVGADIGSICQPVFASKSPGHLGAPVRVGRTSQIVKYVTGIDESGVREKAFTQKTR